ncbi:MAG TPA: ABC transporter permease [Gemmatimonadaceae bacterium]|nr:ABC transporter permease [Gemmatimonadaceae bacterium]
MSLMRRLFNLGRDEGLSRDIERELSFHMREHVEALVADGWSEADALVEARRRFGNPTFQREQTRESDIVAWLDSLRGDLRYALRALRRSPAFTTVAVASLALGIGANTAIYTLIDAVVVRSLPVPNPEELVQVLTSDDDESGYFTNPMWEQIRDRQTGMSQVAAFSETSLNVADGGEMRRISGAWVSGDFFRLFAMRPAVGRVIEPADDVRGCPATVVLGHGFWQSEYAGRSDVVGKNIPFDGKPYQIVGVVAPGFGGPEVGRATQVFLPICSEAVLRGSGSSLDARSNWWLRVIGRRAPDVAFEELRARMKSIAPGVYASTVPPRWSAENKADYLTRTLGVRPAAKGLSGLRTQYTSALLVMMGAVSLVLLIACANVANLMLARASAREREVAIRMAIGAGRRRLVRQLLTEGLLLAAAGALAGLVVAKWTMAGLVTLISDPANPVALDLSLNPRVLGFTVLTAGVTALIFGLIPAWRGTRVSPQTAMKASARGVAEGHGRFTFGKSLVVAQVALSLTLLVGAGLLVGSLRNLSTMDPGFSAEGVLIANSGFRRAGIPAARFSEIRRDLLMRVRSLPGVQSAALADLTPVGGSSWNDEVHVEGFTPATRQDGVIWFNQVSDAYFATMDTRLLAGRDFDATDVVNGPKTAIVTQSVAERVFAGKALGRTYRTKRGDTFSDPVTIVGVVEDAKYRSLREESSGTVFIPAMQDSAPSPGMTFVIRAAGNPLALVASLKGLFADVHPSYTVEFTTLDEQLARSLRRERMLAVLSALFGALALALSMLGLYGVMAYTVARRRNEIGVRIALGADSSRVLRMVLGDVARVVLIGLVIGAGGALASGKLVTSFLYGMEPAEPSVLGAAALLMLTIALAAGLIPAWRAARVDPVSALRED